MHLHWMILLTNSNVGAEISLTRYSINLLEVLLIVTLVDTSKGIAMGYLSISAFKIAMLVSGV